MSDLHDDTDGIDVYNTYAVQIRSKQSPDWLETFFPILLIQRSPAPLYFPFTLIGKDLLFFFIYVNIWFRLATQRYI